MRGKERGVRQNLGTQVQHELSTGIDLTRWVGSIGLAVAVGIVYFVAARLSLALLTKPEGVAVFWPAAGVSAGVLIALGSPARRPVVIGTMAATIVANLSGDRNLWSAVLFGLCNAGEAVLTAWLIEHYFGSDFRLSKLRNVLGLAGAAILGVAVSGIGGAATFKLFHSTTTPVSTIWQHWFASDGLGIITVAPLLIELASAWRDRPPLSELVEGALAVAALALVSGLAIFLRSELLANVGPVAVPSDITLESYPGAYRQVLTSLIFNAVAHGFIERPGGQMLVKARRLGIDQVEITFADDGRGIPEDVQRHVFDPFFTTSRAQGSTGLGLYIVHNLVTQQLGGRITLVSAPGEGTSICMTLPVLAPG
jgi:hypothetical protein